MGKLIPQQNNDFSGGISDAPRVQSSSQFQIAKMFDVFTDPNRLIPYRSLETDATNAVAGDMKQYKIRDFKFATTSAKLYGLGQTSIGLTKILYKENATTGNWSIPATSEGNGAVQNGCFFEFKDYMWGFQGTNQIFKWGLLSGTPAITNSVSTVSATITSVADGVIAKDDNGYMAYNNILVRVLPGGTIQDEVLTLPSNFKITSLTTYGNYLAIGCSPVSTFNGGSKVFLWNLTSDDVQESIDWGEGELRVLETIEGGFIVVVTDRYLNSTVGAGKGSMIIQVYSGGVAQVVKEIFTKSLTGKTIPTSKAVRNNRLFWSAKIMTDDGYVEGIWSFGRKNVNYTWALNLDIIDENVNTGGIQSFGIAGNYFFLSYNGDGSIDKTNDEAVYTFTSVLETQIYDFGFPDNDKKLENLKIKFRRLVSGETVTCKMKVDDASAWTTIGSYSTAGKCSYNFRNIATGAAFPSGKELKFRFESTGGLEITGYELDVTIAGV